MPLGNTMWSRFGVNNSGSSVCFLFIQREKLFYQEFLLAMQVITEDKVQVIVLPIPTARYSLMINYTRLNIRQISRKHDRHPQKMKKVVSRGTLSQKFKQKCKTLPRRDHNITCPSFWKIDVSLLHAVF